MGLTSLPGTRQSQVSRRLHTEKSHTGHLEEFPVTQGPLWQYVCLECQGIHNSGVLIRSGSRGEGGWPEMGGQDG